MSPVLRSLLLLALLPVAASDFLPPLAPSSGNADVFVLQPSGSVLVQTLFYQSGSWYLPLAHVASVYPATCDAARAANLPNVGCLKHGGERVTYFSKIRLVIGDNGDVSVDTEDRSFCVAVGTNPTGMWWGGTPPWALISACLVQSTPAWGSMDLIGTAFTLNTSGVFQGLDRALSFIYTDNNQRATFTADGSCGGTLICTPVCDWGTRLLPIVGTVLTSPSPSGTSSPSTSSTSTATSSPTPGLSCPPSLFRALPRTDLVGAPLTDAPLAVSSEGACRIACCGVPSCDGYALAFTELRFSSAASCFLYANVTAMAAVSVMASGLRVGIVLPGGLPAIASPAGTPLPAGGWPQRGGSVTPSPSRNLTFSSSNAPSLSSTPLVRFIRVEKPQTSCTGDSDCCLNVFAIEALDAANGMDVAAMGVAVCSSFHGGALCNYAIDGSVYPTVWHSRGCSKLVDDGTGIVVGSSWIEIDLRTPVSLSRIVYIARYYQRSFGATMTTLSQDRTVLMQYNMTAASPWVVPASSDAAPYASEIPAQLDVSCTPPSLSGTPTPSPTPYCMPSLFRTLPRMDLVGTLVGTALNPGSRVLLPSEPTCRQACCDAPACDGYSFASGDASLEAPSGVASCFLLVNITQLIPNNAFSSGIYESTL